VNFDAGHIAIDLGARVSIVSSRPRYLGRVFKDRTPAAARALVPLLFAVCGQAQLAACTLALARAEGDDGPAGPAAPVVRLEAVREHLMRIAVDWSRAVGEEPDVSLLRRIHGLVALATTDAPAAQAEAVAMMRLLVASPGTVLHQGPDFMNGANTIAARLLRALCARGWQGLGESGAGLDDDEASCLSLVWNDPALAAARQQHGTGLLLRLFARLVHLSALLDGRDTGALAARMSDDGSARVETARGLLAHRAVIADGRIAAYEITAPTDVNFIADGPAARGLAALAAARHDGIEKPARLLIEAFDPCVAYSLRVQ
jgi:uptake hydrogenase large subunit